MKQKTKDVISLLKTETYLKKDILNILMEAASRFADSYEEEEEIALELYKKLVGGK